MLMSRFCGCFKRPNGNGEAALVVVPALVVAELLPEVTFSLLVVLVLVVVAAGEEEAKASIIDEGPRNDGVDEEVGGG